MLGVFIWLAMKFGRSHLMDHVIVGLDSRLSRETFQRLLQLRVDQLPASVCSLTSPIVAMVPATFAPLAVAIGWLAGWRASASCNGPVKGDADCLLDIERSHPGYCAQPTAYP